MMILRLISDVKKILPKFVVQFHNRKLESLQARWVGGIP
ncbi:MAG: hypothetical protein GHCLOJNM_00084 [bacterium]|nr:hypothetical protein [bacterium]